MVTAGELKRLYYSNFEIHKNLFCNVIFSVEHF